MLKAVAPGDEVGAVWAAEVGRHHGAVEGNEVGFVLEPEVQRGMVAVADEGFGVGADERGVEVGEEFGGAPAAASAENAVDGRAIDALGLLANELECLLQPFHVIFRFAKMGLESLLKLRIGAFLDHSRQRLHDLFFGIIDIAQRVHEQVVHALDIF